MRVGEREYVVSNTEKGMCSGLLPRLRMIQEWVSFTTGVERPPGTKRYKPVRARARAVQDGWNKPSHTDYHRDTADKGLSRLMCLVSPSRRSCRSTSSFARLQT